VVGRGLIQTQTDFPSAADRACDNQHNSCADVANNNKTAGITVGDCDSQDSESAPAKAPFVLIEVVADGFVSSPV
jgi:hypothetical protein